MKAPRSTFGSTGALALIYRTYKDTGHMLESLRQAQLAILRDGPIRGVERVDKPDANAKPGCTPPFYWAAFVLSGDWR